jgi:hypothetical protein
MDLKETGWEGVEWIHLAQDRDRWRAVVNAGSGATELVSSFVCSTAELSVFLLNLAYKSNVWASIKNQPSKPTSLFSLVYLLTLSVAQTIGL